MGKRGSAPLACRGEVIERLRGGQSASQLADEFGVATWTVCRWARQEGIVLARGSRGGLQDKVQADYRRAIDLLTQGYSTREVARELGYSRPWACSVRSKFFLMKARDTKDNRLDGYVDQVGNGRVGRGRRLSHTERVAIALGLAEGKSIRAISHDLHRDPSTISREIKRATVEGVYDARVAHNRACHQRKRPKVRKLEANAALREQVVTLLNQRYSPGQIAIRLAHLFGNDTRMRVSHETIYQALYLHGAGALRNDITRDKVLRSGRGRRICRSPLAGLPTRRRKPWVKGHELDLRLAIADDRAVAGHWEGNLIIGGGRNQNTALITLVERSSRFLPMSRLGVNHDSETVIAKLTEMVSGLSAKFDTITWDQGVEMAQVKKFTDATGIKVYFAKPHSPWQRPTNERVNRDIREYFPKGTNFANITDEEVTFAANELNNRARVVLDGHTPREILQKQINDALTT